MIPLLGSAFMLFSFSPPLLVSFCALSLTSLLYIRSVYKVHMWYSYSEPLGQKSIPQIRMKQLVIAVLDLFPVPPIQLASVMLCSEDTCAPLPEVHANRNGARAGFPLKLFTFGKEVICMTHLFLKEQ